MICLGNKIGVFKVLGSPQSDVFKTIYCDKRQRYGVTGEEQQFWEMRDPISASSKPRFTPAKFISFILTLETIHRYLHREMLRSRM